MCGVLRVPFNLTQKGPIDSKVLDGSSRPRFKIILDGTLNYTSHPDPT